MYGYIYIYIYYGRLAIIGVIRHDFAYEDDYNNADNSAVVVIPGANGTERKLSGLPFRLMNAMRLKSSNTTANTNTSTNNTNTIPPLTAIGTAMEYPSSVSSTRTNRLLFRRPSLPY